MARLTARRRVVGGVAIAVTIAAITTGAAGLRSWRPFDHSVAQPTAWPVNIAPLAEFVEFATDTTFLHPIKVRFLTGDAYASAVGASGSLAASDLDEDAAGRALGLWSGEPSKRIAAAGGRSAAAFPATWLADDDELVVQAIGGRARLSPRTRFTLTALLTEVLQEQRYGVVERIADTTTMQGREALTMVSTGQASWVGNRYLGAMNADDAAAVAKEFGAARSAGQAVDAATPPAVLVARDLRQQAGAAFIVALRARDPDLVGDAFTTDRPSAVDQVLLPDAKYRQRDRTERIDPPPVPKGGTLIEHRQIGPVAWSLLFTTGLADNVALRAADGWGADAATVYRLDGRVCVDGRIVADGRAAADRIEVAATAWATSRPSASGMRLRRTGDVMRYSTCDPGPDAAQPELDDQSSAAVLARARLIDAELAQGRSAAEAECIWVPLFEQFTRDQIAHDRAAAQDYDDAVIDCTG